MAITLTPLKHFQGGAHLTPDPDATNRDLAVQLREIQTALNSEGMGVSVAVPQPLGVAAAGSSTTNANEDHVHAHGNQLGGTLHADAIAGAPGTAGFMTGAQAAALAAIVSPVLDKGAITLAAHFPTAALVQTGWLYHVGAAVTDNDGTRTNTGQVFRAGDDIQWTGAAWTVYGAGATPQFTSVTFRQLLNHGNSGANYTIDWALAQHHQLTLTATCTLALTNPPGPASYMLKTIQGGAGGWGLNWPAATIFAGKVAPVPTAPAGSVDLFTVYFDGTLYHVGVAMADCGVAP